MTAHISNMKYKLSLDIFFLNIITVFMVILTDSVICLKITSLSVPPRADPRFDEPEMICRYEFGKEGLFTVKWYKDEREFYRYLPTYDPQIIHFPIEEVSLSEDGFVQTKTTLEKRTSSPEICNLTSCTIRLVNVSAASAGEYSCEISSERPYFNTDIKSMNLSFIALPNAPPTIEGVSVAYSPGDMVFATCISAESLPQSMIAWSINNQQPPKEGLCTYSSTAPDKYGLTRSMSQLHFRAEDSHFIGENSQMTITCEASLLDAKVTKKTHATALLTGYDRITSDNQRLEWNSGCYQSSRDLFIILKLLVGFNMSLSLSLSFNI